MSKKDKVKKEQRASRKKIKHIIGWATGAGVVLAIAYLVITAPKAPDSEFISKNGLHWHSHLVVKLNGVEQTLPKDMGLAGPVESPVHIHENDNIVHMEFNGAVKKDDIRLQRVFELWNKDWTDTSFMGMPINTEHHVVMKVNGQPSTENGQLLMADKQEIEIAYN